MTCFEICRIFVGYVCRLFVQLEGNVCRISQDINFDMEEIYVQKKEIVQDEKEENEDHIKLS